MNEGMLKLLLLWLLYLVYMILGALTFMKLEHENEKTIVDHFNKLFQEFNATKNVSDALMNDLSNLFREAFSMGIDPYNPHYQSKWDFAGSFYFVGTVLTTIGFGLTAPITTSGQVCFLIYALLGIPLNVLLFNTLLDQTVNLFTWILTSINRHWRNRQATVNFNGTPRSDRAGSNWEPCTVHIALTCFVVVSLVILLAAPLFVFLENWSFFESVYFSVVAFTTVGFGDFVPSGLHSGSGENLTPHYRVGNWLVIIIGTVFMYTSTALMASVYKQCLDKAIQKCRKRFKRTTGLNRITTSPQAPSTPIRERTPSLSPMRDERKREVAARALQNWRKKPQSIGPVNQVEASIWKRRMLSNNEDNILQNTDSNCLRLDDNHSLNTKIKGQTDIEELNSLEVKLAKEYNQLVKQIQQKRETLISKKMTSNEDHGIDNGVAIMISSPETTCTPPLTIKTDDNISIVSNNSCP